MLIQLLYSPSCHHTPHAAQGPGRSVLSTFWGAFQEALAASRQYRSLTSRGVSHDAAIREALGIGACPSQTTPKPAKPLCFAGKA
jgi:hypothetical protein